MMEKGKNRITNSAEDKVLTINIVNDITNFCFRLLPKPYTEAFAGPKTKFLMSLTIRKTLNSIFPR